MRMIVGLIIIIALFGILVRLLPPAWGLPLYILFVVISTAFVVWERRRIAARRRALERALHKERLDWGERLKMNAKRHPSDASGDEDA